MIEVSDGNYSAVFEDITVHEYETMMAGSDDPRLAVMRNEGTVIRAGDKELDLEDTPLVTALRLGTAYFLALGKAVEKPS